MSIKTLSGIVLLYSHTLHLFTFYFSPVFMWFNDAFLYLAYSGNGVCHIYEVTLHRARLALVTTFGGSTMPVLSRPLRPTQPGHPFLGRCNEYRRWFWPSLGRNGASDVTTLSSSSHSQRGPSRRSSMMTASKGLSPEVGRCLAGVVSDLVDPYATWATRPTTPGGMGKTTEWEVDVRL